MSPLRAITTYFPLKFFLRTAVIALLILGTWAFWLEPASLRVTEYRLDIPQWPRACDGLRIAVLTDLHVGSPYNGLDNLHKIVDATNQSNPDLVLLPGDFVIQGVAGGRFVPPESAAKVLGNLRADRGVFAVLGNHDWWLDPERVQRALEKQGISVLEDRAVDISADACELMLAGVSDFWEGAHDVSKALSSVPDSTEVLVFTHNPDVFPDVPERVTLTIAGHTHGGQVYLPGIGRPIVPSQFGERYAIGHIEESGRHMYVSSGIGTSIIPVRFLVPPEISIVTVFHR